jgi:hypothetical protein
MGITSNNGLNFFKDDGILGLHPVTSYKGTSFVRNLKEKGLIDNMLISIFPKRNTIEPESYPSFKLGGF